MIEVDSLEESTNCNILLYIIPIPSIMLGSSWDIFYSDAAFGLYF